MKKLGGISGTKRPWRLPTRTELLSILIHDGSIYHIDSVFPLSGSHSKVYWYEHDTGASNVDFQYGTTTYYTSACVRCVREGLPRVYQAADADVTLAPAPTFEMAVVEDDDILDEDVEGDSYEELGSVLLPPEKMGRFLLPRDGTVIDPKTGLRWMQKESDHRMSWQDALAFCTDYVDESGRQKYRLPNVKELSSIIDNDTERGLHRAFYNTFDKTNIQEWSSTTNSKDDDQAYYVQFDLKQVSLADKGRVFYVRCVTNTK